MDSYLELFIGGIPGELVPDAPSSGNTFTEPKVEGWIPRYVREGKCGPPHGRGSPLSLRQRQKNSEAVAVVGRVVQLIIGKSNAVEFQIGAVTPAILPGQINGERCAGANAS
jgi:hypothetical protein